MNLLRQVRGLPALRTEPPKDFQFSHFICTIEEASRVLVKPGETSTIAAVLLPYDPEAGAREMRFQQQIVKCGICSLSYERMSPYFRHVLHEHGGGVTESRRTAALEEMKRGAHAWREKRGTDDAGKGMLMAEYLASKHATYEGFVRYYDWITSLRKGKVLHYYAAMDGPDYQFIRQDVLPLARHKYLDLVDLQQQLSS